MSWPSRTAAGAPAIATARSAEVSRTVVLRVAVLFVRSGSAVVAATEAWSKSAGRGRTGRTTRVKRAVAPAARRGAVAVMPTPTPTAGVFVVQPAGAANET